ncbi:putative ribonuclease H-like domain-containing protein, partial [Tanacetum coccineum]
STKDQSYRPTSLSVCSDSDYAGSHGDRKSTTEAEYVAVASCCAQSTICIVKNPVFHQRTKHIEIRHHFIRDANEKNLIQVLKIHTDDNVANLLTKAFAGPRFEYLVDMVFCGILFSCDCSFCCAQFDIAGWLVSATSHLVSAGSLQSCWCNNVSAE